MAVSIYTSGFNLLVNHFDYKDAIKNFSLFADEVVIAVNSSQDDTYGALDSLRNTYGNLKLVECDVPYDDPLLDGKIKDIALQATTSDVKIGLDMDERIPLRHKDRWLGLAMQLDFLPEDCVMIPSLNLWGSYGTIKNDLSENLKSYKWYLHGPNLRRGPVNFARRPNGTIDTSRSDSCELIYPNGDLVHYRTLNAIGVSSIHEFLDYIENQITFVYHLGYANFQNRVDRNKSFWYNHWRTESGGEAPQHQVHMDISEFKGETIPHNLPHWNEGTD